MPRPEKAPPRSLPHQASVYETWTVANKSTQTNVTRIVWSLVLALAGSLDILATVLPSQTDDTCDAEHNSADECIIEKSSNKSSEFVSWLVRHHIAISFFFSSLWFIDAFRKAQSAKKKVNSSQERDRLHMSVRGTTMPPPKNTRRRPRNIASNQTNWDSHLAYYRAILWQLLLLPVGFYVAIYYAAQRISHGQEIEDLDEVDESVVVKEPDLTGAEDHYEVFSMKSKKALLFVFIHYIVREIGQTTMQFAKLKSTETIHKLVRKELGRAVTNPVKFRRRVVTVLAYIRYVKYGAPLIGKSNRIIGMLKLTWKRQRQRLAAAKARRIREKSWKSKPIEVRELDAAIKVQSVYRARQARRHMHALRIFQADRQYIAVLKMQIVLKRKLREKRAYLHEKKEELKELQKMKEKNLTDEQKLRIYELRDELMTETSEILNRKLLLRPNTSFAVYWKLFFAICLIWEVANGAAKPWLRDKSKKSKSNSNLPKTLEELVAQKLVPTRVSELPQCQEQKTKSKSLNPPWILIPEKNTDDGNAHQCPWYCHKPYSTIQEAYHDVMSLLLIPKPLSEFPECQPPKASKNAWKLKRDHYAAPWYCEYEKSHRIYRLVVDTFWDYFAIAVGVGYFFDVPITFFTGVFHPENGVLMPEPFFKRWILPGIVLQLLVNPYMKKVSKWTFSSIEKVLETDPVRVYRWVATVFFPIFYMLLMRFLVPAWLMFVDYQNRKHIIPLVTFKQSHKNPDWLDKVIS